MLEVIIPDQNGLYDEDNNRFVSIKGAKLELEHSLVSLQKWESIWHKPFLDKKEKTYDEIVSYLRCMTVSSDVTDQNIYYFISPDDLKRVIDYMNDSMTATWFSDGGNAPGMHKNDVVTAEVIYYWMITLNIPSEYRYWHLNQLLTLIKTVSLKNAPDKKMSKSEERAQRHALNKARRAKYKSKG